MGAFKVLPGSPLPYNMQNDKQVYGTEQTYTHILLQTQINQEPYKSEPYSLSSRTDKIQNKNPKSHFHSVWVGFASVQNGWSLLHDCHAQGIITILRAPMYNFLNDFRLAIISS